MIQTIAPSEVLTLEEAAAYMRLSLEVVERQVDTGELPGRQIEGEWRFLKAALDDWLAKADRRSGLLRQAGVFADDPALPLLLKQIYAARKRPETEEG